MEENNLKNKKRCCKNPDYDYTEWNDDGSSYLKCKNCGNIKLRIWKVGKITVY